VTNREAERLVAQALRSGAVLTIRTPGGDTVTASANKALLWGRNNRDARPWGNEMALWATEPIGVASAVVMYAGRGAAARATTKGD
jgi:hypothetical protein